LVKQITPKEVQVKRFTVGLAALCALLVMAGSTQSQDVDRLFHQSLVPINTEMESQMFRDVVPPENNICFQMDGFCDRVYFQVDAESGLIEGFDDNCFIGNSLLVGGQYFAFPDAPDNEGPWVIFLDYKPADLPDHADVKPHEFEYGIIRGQGIKGFLQRYWPDGTPYEGDMTAVTLLPCDSPTRGTPTSIAD
jgi:hypothetical protein